MGKTCKFVLLGTRHPHSVAHLQTLQHLEEVESIILCDADAAAARELRTKYPDKITAVSNDFDALLAKGDAECVLACLPTDENGPAVFKALKEGRHVMSEKPVGISSGIISQLVDAARANKTILSVCYQNRYLPIVQDMRRYVADGILGEVMNVEARMVTSQVQFRDPSHWLFQNQRSGGGILSWLMCHYFDLLQFILQDEIVKVMAMVGTLNGDPIDVEDTASGALLFGKGALGAFNAGYLLSLSKGGYTSASYDTCIGIRGKFGSLTWERGGTTRLKILSTSPNWNAAAPSRVIEYSENPAPGYGGYSGRAFMRQYLRAVLEGEAPPTTGDDALQVARIIEACYHSNATGTRVKLG